MKTTEDRGKQQLEVVEKYRDGKVVAVEWRQKCIIICTDELDALSCCRCAPFDIS